LGGAAALVRLPFRMVSKCENAGQPRQRVNEQQSGEFLRSAEACATELGGLDPAGALQRFEELRDDLDDAFSWFLDHREPDEALRVAMAQLDF
jgi:hypothetical protein